MRLSNDLCVCCCVFCCFVLVTLQPRHLLDKHTDPYRWHVLRPDSVRRARTWCFHMQPEVKQCLYSLYTETLQNPKVTPTLLKEKLVEHSQGRDPEPTNPLAPKHLNRDHTLCQSTNDLCTWTLIPKQILKGTPYRNPSRKPGALCQDSGSAPTSQVPRRESA